MWNRKVFIRIVEVLFCIACVVALRVTDDESRRIFHYLRSRSREWSTILNNVTWGAIGAALATATCGGYIIITAGLLVAAATNELKGRKTEIFLLGLGVILFGIVGGLSLASIESVPQDLIDNGAVLGALCLATALLFIADLLIGLPSDKKKEDVTRNFPLAKDKDAAKRAITTTLTSEKESTMTGERDVDTAKKEGPEGRSAPTPVLATEEVERPVKLDESQRQRTSKSIDEAGSEVDTDTENLENGRVLRETSRNLDEPKMFYKTQDIYQRPVDEVDTPPFPLHLNGKLVNPAVKIMRVDRDVQDNIDNYRYSDTSQYDNVPGRMRAASPGILKKNRDVSFNVPAKRYDVRGRDEIEMLEESFCALRSNSVATQTQTPSSPTDPGYVRHTASNWPRDVKAKSLGSSSERFEDR